MRPNIYYAAPLHNEDVRKRNTQEVEVLRKNFGDVVDVYLPQEQGVWEDLVRKEMAAGRTRLDAIAVVKQYLFKADVAAIQSGQCVALVMHKEPGKAPSEGCLWEMGYAAAQHIPVVLIDDEGWDWNIMPLYGSTYVADNCDEAVECLRPIIEQAKEEWS